MVGESQVKGGILMIVGFMLVVTIGAELLPDAITSWYNATTTSWNTSAEALWLLVPVFVILGAIFYFLGQAFDLF